MHSWVCTVAQRHLLYLPYNWRRTRVIISIKTNVRPMTDWSELHGWAPAC